jgi:hypothetical protein
MLNKIIKEVITVRNAWLDLESNHCKGVDDVACTIYINYDYYKDVMHELAASKGLMVGSPAQQLRDCMSIMGYKVFALAPVNDHSHPDFVVCIK